MSVESDKIPYDPLGAKNSVVSIETVQVWSEEKAPKYHLSVEQTLCKSPFPYDENVNSKVALWPGDITQLGATVIVNSTNESFNEQNPVSFKIYDQAGPGLKKEVQTTIKTCRTGEAKMTKGYNLPARYVIHTVGPKYNVKYHTAAESALYNCYRNVLQLIREEKLTTAGVGCIHSLRRNYPPEDGAHIALRTVRRFLEKYGDGVEKLIFVVTDLEEMVYKQLMGLYFPRSEDEAYFAVSKLPRDVGNEDGEPVIEERQIRITNPTNPSRKLSVEAEEDEDEDAYKHGLESEPVGKSDFAQMTDDHDKERFKKIQGKMVIESERVNDQRRYVRLLRRARLEDLSDIAALRCIYQSGVDVSGRTVLIFLARNFTNEIDLEKASLYLIRVMDNIVSSPFSVVYVNTNATRDNQPSLALLKHIHSIVDDRYKQNLGSFLILHPTFWSKMTMSYFTTFTASTMKDKIHRVQGIEELYTRISPDQLELPDFVIDYDFKVNGTRYYIPPSSDGL